jgi:hypothetical protein
MTTEGVAGGGEDVAQSIAALESPLKFRLDRAARQPQTERCCCSSGSVLQTSGGLAALMILRTPHI